MTKKDYGKANKYTGDSLHGPKKLVYASISIFLSHLFISFPRFLRAFLECFNRTSFSKSTSVDHFQQHAIDKHMLIKKRKCDFKISFEIVITGQ